MNIKTLLIPFIMLTVSIAGTVNGCITDIEGSPMIGANVMILNSDIGTTSNVDGCFYINGLMEGKYTILVNYIGFYDEKLDFYISEYDIQNEDQSEFTEKLGLDVN